MRRRRLKVILGVGGVVVIAGAAFHLFWLYHPVGEGPAGPGVGREPFEEVWTERKVVLLGVGDSVTAGFGVPKGYGYFDRLVANPDDEFPDMQGVCLSAVLPNLRAENLSRSGSNSIDHLRTLSERRPQQDPDALGIVVMTTGGNDLIHWYGRTAPREGAMYGATWEQAQPWIASFEQRLGEMFDVLDARFPGGCHVFTADIYDPTDGAGTPGFTGLPSWPDGLRILEAYNDAIRRCAERRPNVHLVPMHDAFLGHGIYCRQFWREHYRSDDPHYWFGDNLEDPNHRGYDAIRRLFLIEVARALPESDDLAHK